MKIKLDIVKYRFLFLALSAVLLLPGIAAMIYSTITYPTHTPMKVGIDYTGGTTLQYGVNETISNNKLADVRTKLEQGGVQNPYLQIINVNAQEKDANIKAILSIRTKFIEEGSTDQDKITNIVSQEFSSPELVQVSSVGPTLGMELFKNSLIAFSLALLGIIAYLTFRFQFDYAFAAILGLVHDAIFVCGVFSILKEEIKEIVNISIKETLSRSIYTSLTTLLTLTALYFFGGVTTKDFVLAMILGIAVGTYSSIFFCSTLVDIWEDRKLSTKTVSA